MSDPTMIDQNRIAELRAEIGEDSFAEIAGLFLEEMDAAIAELKNDPDYSKLEARLHSLKGSALNLGLTDLVAICHTGERAAANGNYHDVDVTAVIATYEKTRPVMMEHLDIISV